MKKKHEKRVLVIDDNKVIRQITKTLLNKNGYEVQVADNGLEGIKLAESFNPHVVLLDVMMPVMDGYEVCSKLKKSIDTTDIPVIMLTAKTESVDKLKGFEMGAADYITKPFDRAELLARVSTHARMKSMWDELQHKNILLEKLSINDELTRIYNYRYFTKKLKDDVKLAKRYKMELCCAILDIDFFKKVNDTYGHLAGDLVLKSVAQIITANIRDTDILARYGGEEFAIIMPQTFLINSMDVLKRIKDAVQSNIFTYDSSLIRITVSIGVASLTTHQPESKEELVRFADKALYKAKDSGRNRVLAYGPA